MSKLVIAFCTEQAIGQKANRKWNLEQVKFQGEEAFHHCTLIHFWKVEVALFIDFSLSQQLDALWQKQVANTG